MVDDTRDDAAAAEPEISPEEAPVVEAAPAEEAAPAKEAAPAEDAAPAEEAPAEKAAPEEEAEAGPPPADPATCKAIAIGMDAFLESVIDGEWDGTDFQYYLEPAGVLQATLKDPRADEDDTEPAGLLMTRAGWQARKVFLDDGINPDTYELSFPKEFGYIKTVSHYKPETREHAQFPWSKKY